MSLFKRIDGRPTNSSHLVSYLRLWGTTVGDPVTGSAAVEACLGIQNLFELGGIPFGFASFPKTAIGFLVATPLVGLELFAVANIWVAVYGVYTRINVSLNCIYGAGEINVPYIWDYMGEEPGAVRAVLLRVQPSGNRTLQHMRAAHCSL